MFKKSNLAKFAVITRPGKYKLGCYSDVTNRNLVDGKYITTLKAIASDKLGQVREAFGTEEEIAIERTNGLFLTANIWDKEGVRLPAKGEMVEATIDYVTARNSEEQVLRVVALSVPQAETATKFNVESFFAPAEEVAAPEGTVLEHA